MDEAKAECELAENDDMRIKSCNVIGKINMERKELKVMDGLIASKDAIIGDLEDRIKNQYGLLVKYQNQIKELEAENEECKNKIKELFGNGINLPTEAYAVVLKMMDSHCLVGGKIFLKEPDAETFQKYVTHKVKRLLDIVKVKILDNYTAPKEQM